jgi:hypothetical protein
MLFVQHDEKTDRHVSAAPAISSIGHKSLAAQTLHIKSNSARLAKFVLMFVGAVGYFVSGRLEGFFLDSNTLLVALVCRLLSFSLFTTAPPRPKGLVDKLNSPPHLFACT